MTAVIDDAAQTAEDDLLPIECTAAVYLNWDAESASWEVAPSTMDGYGLDWTGEDQISSDLVDGYDAHSPAKQAEWDDAEAAPMPTGIELSKALNLSRAVHDGDFQDLLLALSDTRHELAHAATVLNVAGRADAPAGAFVEAQGDLVWALTKTLDAAMNLLADANIIPE